MADVDLDDLLIARIFRGQTTFEDHLDEREIGRAFDVRRIDVRTTLSRLFDSGVVTRARRVGTSPANRSVLYHSAKLADSLGSEPRRFRTIDMTPVTAPRAIAGEFDLPVGTPMTRVHRLALSGERVGESWAIWSTVDLEAAFGPDGIPDDLNWYDVIGRATGLERLHVTRVSSALRATYADAELLAVEVGDPLIFVDRTIRALDGTFIDRSFGRMPGARVISVNEDILDLRRREESTRPMNDDRF